MDGSERLPVGRQVAYWRGRRKLSQQMFADRLGRSKSWVDKVERGVRALDRVSTLQDIAAVLRIDPAVLLGGAAQPVRVTAPGVGLEGIRAALSRYEIPLGRPPASRPVLPVDRLTREVAHAWTTFQYARYPMLLDLLPDLLVHAERTHARHREPGRVPLVEVYRVTAALLVKLGAVELAWLAVDRAVSAATGDRALVAAAAVQLGQVLRASGQARIATSAMRTAAYRIGPADPDAAAPAELSLCGTLLVQAALAAARCRDDFAAAELLAEAAELAVTVGDGQDHHQTGFGPTAVGLARVAVAVELGDARHAVTWHEKSIQRDGWRWLPTEHRAAHLIDAARAYLHAGEPADAGRVLLEAERIAPAEIHHRPVARDVVAHVARDPDAPATITRLAVALRVT